MSSLPGASEQQRVLRSPFDIETHKATFVNYLEVCIDEGGTPHYAVPSHQEWLVRELMRLRGFVEQGQAWDVLPACGCMDALCEMTRCVAVWNDCALGRCNARQRLALRRRPHWEEPQEIIDAIARQYHIDYWEGQENHVEVWVEKDALIGIVEQISDKLYVACFSCRGCTGQSELRGAAMRLKRRCDAGQHAVLLRLGDHDPSGKDMSRDIVARLELFGADDVEFRRLALNLDQIEEFGPPPNPTKLSDSRAQGCIERFGYECWELDALDPSVISRLIDENVRMYRDEGLYRDVLARENEEKGTLRDLRDGYQGLIQNWSEICENYDICQ